MIKWFCRTMFGCALSLALAVLPASRVWAQNKSSALTVPGVVFLPPSQLATVGISATGTGAGLTFVAQGYDGAQWVTVPMVPLSAGVYGSSVASASANGNWRVDAAGYQQIRVSLTAISGGSEVFVLSGAPLQSAQGVGSGGGGTNVNPSVVTGPTFTGNGSLGLTTASALISTMTPNSTGGALPTTLAMLTALNNSTSGDFAICPLGGTCTCPAIAGPTAATNGLTIKASGGSYAFNLTGTPKTTPTIVACSGTPTAEFQW